MTLPIAEIYALEMAKRDNRINELEAVVGQSLHALSETKFWFESNRPDMETRIVDDALEAIQKIRHATPDSSQGEK